MGKKAAINRKRACEHDILTIHSNVGGFDERVCVKCGNLPQVLRWKGQCFIRNERTKSVDNVIELDDIKDDSLSYSAPSKECHDVDMDDYKAVLWWLRKLGRPI